MQIESRKKKLCLEPLRGIITQGEKMADTVIFRLPATYGALVLSDLSWQIRAASEKNTLVTADLTPSSGGEFCLVQWEVSADFTAVSGALSLMLVGTDSEGNVVIKFPGDDPVWVRDAETGQYSPPEDAIQKALNGLQQAESALEDATKALQEIGINFKILGHFDTLPELEAAVTNPSPGDDYGVGDPTVVYVWNGTSWDPLPGVFQPYPHTNLLVNPRFKYNSRSQQSYTGTGWTLDGWYGYNVTQAGNVLTAQQTGANIAQPIKCDLNLLYGKSIAFSIETSGAAVVFGTATMPQSFSSTVEVGSVSTQWGSISVYWDSSVSQLKFGINLNQGQSITITAAKLELGSVSTLQAELDNPPPEDVEKLKLDMYDLDPGRCAYLPWHNENLLDNWYFVGGGSQQGGGQFPINQRGDTSWSTGGYHLDRWKQEADGAGEFGEEGFTPAVTGIVATTQQVEESVFKRLLGKKVTISALLSSGEFRSLTVQFPSDISQGFEELVAFSNGGKIGIASYPGSKTYQLCRIYIPSNSNKLTFVAIKVELGYLSTLARKDESGNWVLNDPPPNFQQELAKCQRYFVKLNGYAWVGSGQIDYGNKGGQFFIPTPVPMRIKPSISGVLRLYNSKNNSDVGIVGLSGFNENGVNGTLTVLSFDDSSGTSISMWINTGEAIELSAEL